MFCCSKCKDHLTVPAQAVPEGEVYNVVQSFPFICCNNKQPNNNGTYTPVCVKEFQEASNRSFLVHVRIVAHFTTELDSSNILVRYSTQRGTYEEANRLTQRQTSQLPDIYFVVMGKKVKIYAKHFTVFIIKKKTGLMRLFSKSPTQRHVNLVAHAYFSENAEERSVVLRVYLRDTECKDHKSLKEDTEEKEIRNMKKYRCVDDEALTGLPDTIERSTKFQCIISCCQSKWKKLISTLVIKS